MNKVFNKKINKIVLSVLAVIVIILALSFRDINNIKTTFKRIAHDIKLSSVDVSGFELSTIIIDSNGTQYDSLYEWNATNYGETNTVTYQINYKRTNSSVAYAPGDLEIKVPILGLLWFDGISADSPYSDTKIYTFSYEYHEIGYDSYDYVVLKNNNEIEAYTNFEGSININIKMYSGSIPNNTDEFYSVTLNNQIESNAINFKFTSTQGFYRLISYDTKISSYDGLPSGNYIWVKARLDADFYGGVREIYSSGDYEEKYKVTLPEGAIVASVNGGFLKYDDSDYYHFLYGLDSGSYTYTYLFFGFPRELYENSEASYKLDLYGIYKDTENDVDDYSLVASVEKTFNVADYEFSYSGDLYSIAVDRNSYPLVASNSRYGPEYDININAVYSGEKMDVRVGSDLLYVKKGSNEWTKLSDNDYHFTEAYFHPYGYKNGNGLTISEDKYDVDLFVRYANTNNYVKYGDTFKFESNQVLFTEDNIVAFYFVIYDVSESLMRYDTYDEYFYRVSINNGVLDVDDILNTYAFLEVYKSGTDELLNSPPDSSYLNTNIREYDNAMYGHNVQRGMKSLTALDESMDVTLNGWSNDGSGFISDDLYKISLKHTLNFSSSKGGLPSYFEGYEFYDLLPEGVYVKPEEIRFYSYPTSEKYIRYIKKINGGRFSSTYDYIDFINNHMRVSVINNWHNTNRSLVKVILDYSDEPLDFSDLILVEGYPRTEQLAINYYISTDSIIEYGDQSRFDMYIKPYNHKYLTQPDSYSYIADSIDLNDDGDTSEYFYKTYTTWSYSYVSESNQDLTSFAKSYISNYSKKSISVAVDNDYTYKVRVRNASNKITNLVIYDNLEGYVKQNGNYVLASGDDTNTFKGEFIGVDTSSATRKGYVVKTYYSQSSQPGSIEDDNSWVEYEEGVTDNSLVKSLAFEFLDYNGDKAVLPNDSNIYVEINMKAPSSIEEGKTKTYNGSWVEWNALDSLNQIIPDIVGINSNIVSSELAVPLKVKHLDYTTHEELAPEEDYYYLYGEDYYTNISYDVPNYYRLRETAGDSPTGTINKYSYEVIYYYEMKSPEVYKWLYKEGTSVIHDRTAPINYSIYASNGNAIWYYEGNSYLTIVDTLPYQIDVSQSDLGGGTYNAENNTITWNYEYSSDENHKTIMNPSVNISVVYTDIPYTDNRIVNRISESITYDGNVQTASASFTTVLEEPHTLTVYHLDNETHEPVSETQTSTVFAGDSYYAGPVEIYGYEPVEIPSNVSGQMLNEDITVTYYYRKRAMANANVTKTGPESIDSKGSRFDYSIVLDDTNTVDNYYDASIVLIEDFLPFEIDEERSNLNGGIYNKENKLIKWVFVHTPDENGHTDLSRTIDFTVYYKDHLASAYNITNSVEETIYYDDYEAYSTASCYTSYNYSSSIRVKHLEYGTDNVLAPEEYQEYPVGTYYNAGPADDLLSEWEVVETPSNARGYVSDEEIVVIFYYKPSDGSGIYMEPYSDSSNKKNGSSYIDRDSLYAYYSINYDNYIYNASGKDYTVTIVDSLPYEIDTTKSYSLNGGEYNPDNKTITWVLTGNRSGDRYNVWKTYSINFYYKDIPDDVKEVTNYATYTTDVGGFNDVMVSSYTTKIKGPCVLTVYHKDIDTDETYNTDTSYYFMGDEYETSPNDYILEYADLVSTPENASGRIESEATTVTYYYEKKAPFATLGITKSGNYGITDWNSSSYISLNVSGYIYNYFNGDYTLTMVDYLPYEIDIGKSTISNDGVYDPISNTITWTVNRTTYSGGSTNAYNYAYCYLYYKNIPGNVRKIHNTADAFLTFDNKTYSASAQYDTYIQRRADLYVNHYDVDTNEALTPQEYWRKSGGDNYETSPSDKVPLNYDLTSTPLNASGKIQAEETTVDYYYKKREPVITSEIEKTSTDAIDHRSDAVDYTISYDTSITDYIGDTTITIVDTLPYDINTTLSNLDGGVYDATNNTITWTHNENVELVEKQDYSYIHTISLVYKDVPLSVRSYSNSVTGTTTADDTSESSTATSSTEVNEKYTLKVKHLEYGTNTPLADEETSELFYGESYTTSASSNIPGNYKLKITPDNANNTIQAEETVVTYYYEKKDTLLTSVTTIVGTDAITKRSNSVSYTITYNTTIKDHLGDATITIVDTLPYEIDTTKTYNLDGGVYNSTNKTITWTHNESITNIDTSKSYSHSIILVYKDVPISTRTLANSAVGTTTVGSKSESSNADASTDVNEKYTLRVKHLEYGTNTPLVDDETSELLYGASYTTSPSSNIPGNYKLKTTPANANSTIQAEETIVTYYYEKKDVLLTSTINKTGTSELTNRSNTVEYTITYTTTIKDHLGDATTTIVDTLPYEIDTTKTYNLDGGTYNSTNKTITWTHNENVTDINTSKTYTHTISLVYKDMPISVRSITNSVTGTTTALSVNSNDTKTLTTAVNEAFNLKVKHLEYGTNTPVATEENRPVYYGDEYTTSPSTSIPDNYKLKITPDNANSTIQAEETVVTYYYEKKDSIITSTLEKTGTTEVDNKTNAISYRISYNGSIKDFLGDATITIVDTLPYEIDTSLSNLNGGTYNNNDKTITWTNNINVTSINTTKSYTYNISVVYKNIPITVRSITNSVRATTSAGNGSDVKQANLATAINQPYTLKVKHLEYGTNTPVADEETYTKYGGDAYTTSASSNIPDNYELKITPTNNTGTIQAELTEVIYYYQKKDPVLSSSITKTGNESISSYDDIVEYTITYNSSIKDYIGSSSVSIVDTLPYEIDETASILDGGTYNSNTKTITWTNNENITSVAERNITYTYNIKLKYINIIREDTLLSNTVSSTTTLSNKTDTKETTSNTNIEIKGKIIVQYIDIDTNEEISSEIESIDILNKEFVPESLDIKGYNLVQVPDKVKYYYDSETQTIKFLYRKMAVVKGVEEVIENPKTGKAYIYVLVCTALIFVLIGAFKIAYSARVFRKF